MSAHSRASVWTPDRKTELQQLYTAGVSVTEIADRLQTTPAAVQSQASRQMIQTARMTSSAVRDAILRRDGQGFRPSRIAVTVGVDRHVVDAVLAAREIHRMSREDRDAEIMAMHATGLSVPEIATRLAVHANVVNQSIKRSGTKPNAVSDDLRSDVLRMRRDGLSLPEMEQKSGLSQHAVSEIVRDFKVVRPWTDDLVEELRSLHAEGHTAAEIGRRLGLSRNRVVGKIHHLKQVA